MNQFTFTATTRKQTRKTPTTEAIPSISVGVWTRMLYRSTESHDEWCNTIWWTAQSEPVSTEKTSLSPWHSKTTPTPANLQT